MGEDKLADAIHRVLVDDLDCDGYASGYASGLANWLRSFQRRTSGRCMVNKACQTCEHPADHHDAGECWTDNQGREVWDGVADQCRCSWYEPQGEGE